MQLFIYIKTYESMTQYFAKMFKSKISNLEIKFPSVFKNEKKIPFMNKY